MQPSGVMAAGQGTLPRRPVRSAGFALLALALSCAGMGTATQAQDAGPPVTPPTVPSSDIDPTFGPGEAASPSIMIADALAAAEPLILEGRPVDAFVILMETMDTLPKGTDDAPLRFAVAQALMAGGRLEQAEQVLARLAEERPDNLRIRLDLAAVLFQLDRDEEAEALFREVLLAPELPPEVRRTVDGYLADIRAREGQRGTQAQAAGSPPQETEFTVPPGIVGAALVEADRQMLAGDAVAAMAVLEDAMGALPEGTDDAPLRYALAQVLMAEWRLEEAERILASLSDEQPENLQVRLDRASLLFALGRDRDSRRLFREARRAPDISPDVRREVEGLLAELLARQRLRIDLDLGLRHDGNVNGAAETDTVAIPIFGNLEFVLDERPVAAWVARTGATLSWRKPVTVDGRVLIETAASASRDTAIGASEFNRTRISLSGGPRIGFAVPIAGHLRSVRFSADLGLERHWQGGSSETTQFWGGLGLDLALDADWNLGAVPRIWTRRTDGQADEADPTGRSLALSVSRRAGPGWLTLGGSLARETAEFSILDWRSHGLSLEYAAESANGWSGSLRLGLSVAKFDEEDATFLVRREDRTRSVGLTLSHRKLARAGYQPVFTLDWSRIGSTVPLHDREPLSLGVGFRRLF